MTIFAKPYSYNFGIEQWGVAFLPTQPDATFIPYDVPDNTWLYLDSTNAIQVYTATQHYALQCSKALPILEQEVQTHIDSVAQRKGYTDGISCASYFNSTNTTWASEAKNFIPWRDSVWAFCQTYESEVQTGTYPIPTGAELIALLPTAPW